jgi:hypothetical protein
LVQGLGTQDSNEKYDFSSDEIGLDECTVVVRKQYHEVEHGASAEETVRLVYSNSGREYSKKVASP